MPDLVKLNRTPNVCYQKLESNNEDDSHGRKYTLKTRRGNFAAVTYKWVDLSYVSYE